VDRRHRLVAIDNLKHAYPQLSEAQIDRLVRDVYRHFGAMIVEVIHLPKIMYATTWRRFVTFPEDTSCIDALVSGRPTLLVSGHLGNWEMGGYALAALGFRTFAIARPLDNPFLHEFLLHGIRQRTGQQIIAKNGEFDRIQKVLGDNGVLATLGDQDAGHRGMFVNFFGRPASTHKAIALLALQYNAVIIVLSVTRKGSRFQYISEVADVIEPEDFRGRPKAAAEITEQFTTAFERLVRRHPEQYLWLHRRWKHQPKTRKTAAA
jgi:KDO2-lipid IV(A) lauroyltransferase